MLASRRNSRGVRKHGGDGLNPLLSWFKLLRRATPRQQESHTTQRGDFGTQSSKHHSHCSLIDTEEACDTCSTCR